MDTNFSASALTPAASYYDSTILTNTTTATTTTTTIIPRTSSILYETSNPTELIAVTPEESMFRLLYLIIVSSTSAFGNLLVLVALCRFRSLRRAANLMLSSLAVADFLVGTITVPLYIAWTVHPGIFDRSSFLCALVLLSCLLLVTASQLSLLFLSVEQYFAVCKPFKHRDFVIRFPWVHPVAILTIWLISVLSTGLSSFAIDSESATCSYYGKFNNTFLLIASVCGVLGPFVLIIILNVKVLCAAQDQDKRRMSLGYHPVISAASSSSIGWKRKRDFEVNFEESTPGFTGGRLHRIRQMIFNTLCCSSYMSCALRRKSEQSLRSGNNSGVVFELGNDSSSQQEEYTPTEHVCKNSNRNIPTLTKLDVSETLASSSSRHSFYLGDISTSPIVRSPGLDKDEVTVHNGRNGPPKRICLPSVEEFAIDEEPDRRTGNRSNTSSDSGIFNFHGEAFQTNPSSPSGQDPCVFELDNNGDEDQVPICYSYANRSIEVLTHMDQPQSHLYRDEELEFNQQRKYQSSSALESPLESKSFGPALVNTASSECIHDIKTLSNTTVKTPDQKSPGRSVRRHSYGVPCEEKVSGPPGVNLTESGQNTVDDNFVNYKFRQIQGTYVCYIETNRVKSLRPLFLPNAQSKKGGINLNKLVKSLDDEKHLETHSPENSWNREQISQASTCVINQDCSSQSPTQEPLTYSVYNIQNDVKSTGDSCNRIGKIRKKETRVEFECEETAREGRRSSRSIVCPNVKGFSSSAELSLQTSASSSRPKPSLPRAESSVSRDGNYYFVSRRVARMVALVCASFILAWFPFTVVAIINASCSSCRLDYFLNAVVMIAFTKSVSNPIIYALCHVTFRRAYSKLLSSAFFLARCTSHGGTRGGSSRSGFRRATPSDSLTSSPEDF